MLRNLDFARVNRKVNIYDQAVPECKHLPVAYYEDRDNGEILELLKTKC